MAARRPITEEILLLFAGLVCVIMVAQVVILTVALVAHPEADFDGLARAIEAEVQILLGAILGYATGRATKPPDGP